VEIELDQFIDVMECGRPYKHECEQEEQSAEGQQVPSGQITKRSREPYKGARKSRYKDYDERELNDMSILVPALGPRNLPAHFREQHLQGQLFVDAEQGHQDADCEPEMIRPAIFPLIQEGCIDEGQNCAGQV